MKKFIIVLGIILVPFICQAAPFLVCTPYSSTVMQPDEFHLRFDGGTEIISPAQTLPDGSKRLYFDLLSIPLSNGNHQVIIHGVKLPSSNQMGGTTPDYPFDFGKGAPSSLSGVSIER